MPPHYPGHPPAPPLAGYRPSNERQPFPPRPAGPNDQRRSRAPQPRKGGGGFLRGIFYFLVLLVVVAGAGIGYLVLNPPSELIRQTLAEQVKARTGRDLIVSGPASFSFYPGLGVSLSDVSLSGPAGSANTLVTMDALSVSVKPLPLLSRDIAVDSLVLTKPLFDFRLDKSGRKNWDFAADERSVRYAQAGGTATDAAQPSNRSAAIAKLSNLHLDDVRIEDGTIRYTDERSGESQQVDALNTKLSLRSLDSPLDASGNLLWKDQTIAFAGTLTSARTVLEQKPAKLAFKANNELITASFDGFTLLKDGADIEGDIKADAASSRALAGWLGTTLPPVAGFGPLSIAGKIKTAGNVTTLSNATFGLDGATATGTVSVTTGGVRPAVAANLDISELDLNNYLTAAAGGAIEQAPPTPRNDPSAGDAIENLLNGGESQPGTQPDQKPGTKVFGAVQRAGWSSDAMNFALLGIADAYAKLNVAKLKIHNLQIGQTRMDVALKDRVLKTDFADVQLYDGRGKGVVSIDGTGAAAGIGANIALDGVSAQPFLKDAADMTWLAGKANVALQVTAAGASQLQLVDTLNGTAKVRFADGAIVGFNLPGVIRGVSQGKFSGLKTAPSEKTDFSELSASFKIENGVAQNQDLQLVSPLLRVTGAGAINLPPRTIDYTLRPKLVASLEGQQGNSALSGIEVPVRIAGPWAKPRIEPDLKGVLADPNKAIEAAKEIGKSLKGKNSDEIVDQLLGPDTGDNASTKAKAKDLLNKFLKP